MKNFKIILILINLIIFTACSSVKTVPKYEEKDVKWKQVEPPVIVLNLEPGDIIVKEKL